MQANLYRPLRAPTVLIGDAKLGGISTTVSSLESLYIRGYDVVAVLMFANDQLQNDSMLKVGNADVDTPPRRVLRLGRSPQEGIVWCGRGRAARSTKPHRARWASTL